jgi:hypothetical protein
MITVILQLKPPYDADPETGLALLAQTALDLFGTGGNPDAAQVEGFIGWVNTPVSGGYVRALVDDYAAETLELIGENEVATIIRVERNGQDMIDDGEGGFVEQLFQTDVDAESNPIFLGRMI